jgi:hypothetical protein
MIKFRVAFQRKFFGDKFWKGRPAFQSRFFDLQLTPETLHNVDRAIIETARSIVLDYERGTPSGLTSVENPPIDEDPSSYVLSELACSRLKSALGYREARALILESGFKWDSEQLFIDIPQTTQEDQHLYDNKLKKNFTYNAGTGYRAWQETYVARDGTVIKEVCYRSDPRHLEYTRHLIDNDNVEEEEDDDESGYFYTDSEVGSRSTKVTRKTKTSVVSKKTRKGAVTFKPISS